MEEEDNVDGTDAPIDAPRRPAVTGAPRCAGKIVVLTGAARGQGAAEALALARAGATVIACDVLEAEGHAAAEHANACETVLAAGGSVAHRSLDVTETDDWIALAYWLQETYGRVDALVNNAGIPSRDRLPEVDLELWERTFRVNVTGPMLGMKYLVPLMDPGSSIVNVTSVSALSGHVAAAYTASKWALRGLSRTASLEFGARGVRVNAVMPGLIDSPMMLGASPAFFDAAITEIPLGRPGFPEDLGPLMVYLVSDESAYMSGAELTIDGGMTSHASHKQIADATAARPKPDEPTPVA